MSKLLIKHPLRSILPVLAAAFGVIATPLAAQAQQPELATSIWCDKAEQIESVVRTHVGGGVALPAAVERANAAAQDPGACIAATAIVVETGESRRLVVGNQMMAIEQFMVIGVVKDGQVLRIQPVMWYAAKVVAKLAAV